jgi:hypothetical protein
MTVILLSLLGLLQAAPPPLGQLAISAIMGVGYMPGSRDLPVPTPRLQAAPAEDCNCGVPASPRGPR